MFLFFSHRYKTLSALSVSTALDSMKSMISPVLFSGKCFLFNSGISISGEKPCVRLSINFFLICGVPFLCVKKKKETAAGCSNPPCFIHPVVVFII